MCKKCDLWAWLRKEKRTKTFMRQTGYLPRPPRRHRPLKVCMRGRVREVVIYFKFHENRSRGFRAVEGRKSPSPVDKAHGLYNSLYYRTSRDSFEHISAHIHADCRASNCINKNRITICRWAELADGNYITPDLIDIWDVFMISRVLSCYMSNPSTGSHQQAMTGNVEISWGFIFHMYC